MSQLSMTDPSSTFYQAFFEGLMHDETLGLMVLDTSGAIHIANAACAKIFGAQDQDNLQGTMLFDLLIELQDEQPDLLQAESIKPREYSGIRLDGSCFPLYLSLVHFHDHNQSYWIAIARDISKAKAAEARLNSARKLEAIGEFTSGIAHNFNNLLTVILGSTRLIKKAAEDVILPDQFLRHLDTIQTTAHRGANQISRLMTFARQHQLDTQQTDMRDFMLSMDEMIEVSLDKSITLKTHINDDLWPALIDPTYFESSVLNIVSNAQDAMPHGGALCIEVYNTTLDEIYCALSPDVEPGDYICIAISDSGTGMDSDVMDRIFDPFFTTKDVGKGTGLGLSTTYGYFKQIGGYIHVYSELNHGTTFKLYIPRSLEESAAQSRDLGHASNALYAGQGRHVLIVEDNAIMQDISVSSFKRLGFDVLTASTAEEAHNILQDPRRPISMMFVDLYLDNDHHGFDLTKALPEHRSGMPVLYTSGYTHHILSESFDIDETQFIAKPFSTMDLSKKLSFTLG